MIPAWAVITDMHEFRLYNRLRGPGQCQRFVLRAASPEDQPVALLPPPGIGAVDAEAYAFRRFVFRKLFDSSFLLARSGESSAESLLARHCLHEREIEEDFYRDYRDYREALYRAIAAANPAYPGTRGRLVRLTQRLLDRCLFVLFCEDMGRELAYPPQLLRDVLVDYARSRFYSPESDELWTRLKELFAAMRDGGAFGGHAISKFNGGLFERDPELDALRIPARLFCAPKQGATQDDASLLADKRTLLYFSGRYNFGKRKDSRQRTIGLTTLGRIFEQSITELEIMEAEADGRVSLNRLGKRKTDGVYYTPEWVTHAIVAEVVGGRLADLRAELSFADLPPLTDEAVAAYRAFQASRGRRTAPVAGEWLVFLKTYRLRVDGLRVVDPACGSGAFLIQALDRLIAEYRWIVDQEERITGVRELWNQDAIIRSILSHNLYGVDINPESVEITQLALWLHTAAPNSPLCTLDRNIRCGNSLVGPDFYADRHPELLPAEERERVNVFDWRKAFPQVFGHGGFDCVIGNPPYIKLQNFRRAQPDVAAYLATSDRADGTPLYASTRSGNFDLYLPFIEKGVELLRPGGRMGYIAPNVWLVNEYGDALRRKLHAARTLERWVDFKCYQVFDEAITYTALQFFRAEPCDAVACLFAPDGPLPRLDWERADVVPYAELPADDAWNFMPVAERRLVARLNASCRRLEYISDAITVGVQTSADDLYQLERLGPGRYHTRGGLDVAVEDGVMRPLISGPEAKRYQRPATATWLLFPYTDDGRLLAASELAQRFPKAWHYLQSHEATLRARESGKMDKAGWWGY
ncbi:MAG: DNA methyltransferase, partial [Lentisphaerota bacterium]